MAILIVERKQMGRYRQALFQFTAIDHGRRARFTVGPSLNSKRLYSLIESAHHILSKDAISPIPPA